MTDWAMSTMCIWYEQGSAFKFIWGTQVIYFIYVKKSNIKRATEQAELQGRWNRVFFVETV